MAPLASPADFPFPFPPYDIQVQFMRTVYSAIEEGKVALMESPTGTVRVTRFNRRRLTARVSIAGQVTEPHLRGAAVAAGRCRAPHAPGG